MVDIVIKEEPITILAEYAQIPCNFTVSRTLAVHELNKGLGGIMLVEEPVLLPFEKDYDAFESPTEWFPQFDLSNWGMLSAFVDDHRVGGCIIAFDTEGITMLEGRKDMTVLWDIRVSPSYRRQGIASILFRHAIEWSRQRKCTAMKIETQNNNVAACCFYVSQGCILKAIIRFAYSDFPDETQLIWYKPIS